MKVVTIGLITSIVIMSSIVTTSLTTLYASSKGLKVFLTVDTNLPSQSVRIETYQGENWVYSHDGYINTGTNELEMQYPSHTIESGRPFGICVTALSVNLRSCGDGYNSEGKHPEHVYVNLFGNNNQPSESSSSSSASSSSSSSSSENTITNTNANSQTVIVCPANSSCVIEQ
jgi:hypothetical protein